MTTKEVKGRVIGPSTKHCKSSFCVDDLFGAQALRAACLFFLSFNALVASSSAENADGFPA